MRRSDDGACFAFLLLQRGGGVAAGFTVPVEFTEVRIDDEMGC